VRTLGALIAPTSGSATIAGISLTPENGVEIRRRISIMPESPGLYLRLSVTENVFALPASAASALQHGGPLLYLLGIPALAPALLAAYSVVGERQQGTLEPVLTTPVRREEFLLGNALAALVPSVAVTTLIAYKVIHATLGLALGLAAALLVLNRLSWRIISATFGRERLMTGTS
jgi:ABC-type transport system involved in multi-copper enzyme maturation permease subunit